MWILVYNGGKSWQRRIKKLVAKGKREDTLPSLLEAHDVSNKNTSADKASSVS